MQLEVRPPPSRAPASMQTFKHLQRPERSWTCLRIEPLDSKLGLDRSLPVAQRQVIGSPNEGRTKAARTVLRQRHVKAGRSRKRSTASSRRCRYGGHHPLAWLRPQGCRPKSTRPLANMPSINMQCQKTAPWASNIFEPLDPLTEPALLQRLWNCGCFGVCEGSLHGAALRALGYFLTIIHILKNKLVVYLG